MRIRRSSAGTIYIRSHCTLPPRKRHEKEWLAEDHVQHEGAHASRAEQAIPLRRGAKEKTSTRLHPERARIQDNASSELACDEDTIVFGQPVGATTVVLQKNVSMSNKHVCRQASPELTPIRVNKKQCLTRGRGRN